MRRVPYPLIPATGWIASDPRWAVRNFVGSCSIPSRAARRGEDSNNSTRILTKRLWREANKTGRNSLANVSIWKKQKRIDNTGSVPEIREFLNAVNDKNCPINGLFSVFL